MVASRSDLRGRPWRALAAHAWLAAFATAVFSGAVVAQPLSFERAYQSGTPAVLTGELTVLYRDDFVNARAELIYTLRDDNSGRSFEIQFQDQPPHAWRTGERVVIRGRAVGAQLYVAVSDASEARAPASTIRPATISGEQKTLLIVANFADASVDCSVADIRQLMFDDPDGLCVAGLYRAASLGAVTFSGDVVGPFVIPFVSSAACDISGWAAAANAQATAAGSTLGDYSRLVYVMPQNSCAAAGYGTVGGSPSHAWVFACHLKGVFAHELGHNVGMDHAATPTSEYGDTTDPMAFSSSELRGVNAPHRQQLGWLADASVRYVESDGPIYIAPLAMDPTSVPGPQVVVIRKPDTQEYYYLSYRLPLGFDAYIDSSYHHRLSIHRYKGDGSSSRTWLLAGLADGESFVDEANGIDISLDSHSSSYALARVRLTPTCTVTTPTMSLDPPSQSGTPGSTTAYTINLTNQDSSVCPASSMQLTATAPSGWTTELTTENLSLNPGETGQATLSVTSPAGSAPGSHNIAVSAADVSNAAHNAVSHATYVVSTTCASSNPLLSASPAGQTAPAGSTVSYTMSLTNQDGTNCPARVFGLSHGVPAGWTASASPASLTVGAGATVQSTLNVTSPSGATGGAHTVTISVSDPSHGAQIANTSITYTISSLADTTPPSPPSNLTAVASQKQKQIQVSWRPASDNVAVTGYRIWRNGLMVGATAGTAWADTSALAGVLQTYFVVAQDGAGNLSAPSNSATASLSGGGKKP